MKKILITFIWLFTNIFAEGYTQENRTLDMQKMAQAMQDIQSGFFYNNLDIVIAGTNDLRETIIKIRPINDEINTKDIYEKWLNNSTAMTGRTQKRIQRYTDDIVERFRDGDVRQALNVYNRISAECMKCHTSLRKW